MALGSGISWAVSAIVSKKLHQRRPDLDLLNITAWPTLLGSLPLIVVALLVPMQTIDWSQTFVLTIIYSVFLSGSLAWVLWTYALQRLQAGVASMASMLAPVIGVVAAWLQLGERPSQLELVGMLFIALALVVISAITIHRHQQVAIAQGQE
jgi:drug/metabolite transporter (DMT)-like permease